MSSGGGVKGVEAAAGPGKGGVASPKISDQAQGGRKGCFWRQVLASA